MAKNLRPARSLMRQARRQARLTPAPMKGQYVVTSPVGQCVITNVVGRHPRTGERHTFEIETAFRGDAIRLHYPKVRTLRGARREVITLVAARLARTTDARASDAPADGPWF